MKGKKGTRASELGVAHGHQASLGMCQTLECHLSCTTHTHILLYFALFLQKWACSNPVLTDDSIFFINSIFLN